MADTNSTNQDKQPPTQPATVAPAPDTDRVAELEAENARLREQLAAAGATAAGRKPQEPSFTFSAGQADELERLGRTTSPFTGKLYVGTSTDNAREATAEEFAKAKPGKADTAKTAKPAAPRGGRAK